MLQGAQLSNTNQKTNGRKKAFVAVGRPFRVMGYRGHTSHEHRTPQVRPWHPRHNKTPHQDAGAPPPLDSAPALTVLLSQGGISSAPALPAKAPTHLLLQRLAEASANASAP